MIAVLASCSSNIKVPVVDFQIEAVSEYDKSRGIIPVYSKNNWEYQVNYFNPLSGEPANRGISTYFVSLGAPIVLELEIDSAKGAVS